MTRQRLFFITVLVAISTAFLSVLNSTRSLKIVMPPQFDLHEIVLTDFPVDFKKRFDLGIENPNSFAIRIEGIAGSCGPGGCVAPVDFQPLILDPGARKSIILEFKSPPQPRPIETMLIFYFSSETVHYKELLLTGNAVDQQ
jgi:hypothetical protein